MHSEVSLLKRKERKKEKENPQDLLNVSSPYFRIFLFKKKTMVEKTFTVV